MENKTFAEKHPTINFLIGLAVLLGLVYLVVLVVSWGIETVGDLLNAMKEFLKKFVTTTDKVIVVAMITGAVSIVGVVISSIVAKVVEYRYNVKKYLYDKREEPYKQFIEMIYAIMADTKKDGEEKMSEEEMIAMISEFSKGLTLWGSNRVVAKWLKYRKSSINGANTTEALIQLEDIIYEIRRDVGLGRRLKKGDMLSFFINDIDNLIKK